MVHTLRAHSIGFELGDGDAVPTPALHNHYKIYIECVWSVCFLVVPLTVAQLSCTDADRSASCGCSRMAIKVCLVRLIS